MPQPSPDTRPQTGAGSATTTNVSDSGKTNGDEGHYVAALVAGRRSHGAKRNRDKTAPQRVTSHITMTKAISRTSTSVTRERGI
jgi:hypothetical protein